MSLYGFSNSGFNNTISGVLNITDGRGTEISNGNIVTNNIDGNNVYLDGSLSSIGSNSVNEFTNGISITSTTSNLNLSLCQGIQSTSTILISPIEISCLENCSSNLQSQIDSLATSTDLTLLNEEVNDLQIITTAISYDASNNDTNINSNCTIWEYLTLYGNLNNITPLQLTMLDSLETDTPVEQRLYELENFRNTYLNDFFYFTEVPVPNFYDIFFTTGNLHLGNNVDCSGNFTFGNTLNGISQTVFNYLSGVTSSIQGQFSNLENNISTISQKLTQVTYNPSVLYTDIQNNVSVTGNLNCNTLNFNVSSSNISYLSGTTSSIQGQFNSITQRISGISYNSSNDYTDITNNCNIYGSFGFTGAINTIPRTTFMYIQNVSSDIQSQFNSLVSSINSISTNLSDNYVDKTSAQSITGEKTFNDLNAGLITTQNLTLSNPSYYFQKRTLFLSNLNEINYSSSYPGVVYYNSTPSTMAENLPNNCYIHLTSGCTSFYFASTDNTEDYGKSCVVINRTTANITIYPPSGGHFTGAIGDYVSSFNLPPLGRAIVQNNSTYWDVITINSYYDWKNGVIALGTSGTYNDSVLIPYSCPNLTNLFTQQYTSSNLGTSNRQDYTVSAAGTYKYLNAYANIDGFIIYPNWGIVVYNAINYGSTVICNYKNSTLNPVCIDVLSGYTNTAASIKVYYYDQMLVKL